MGMVNRRKRTRLSEPDTATAAWIAGDLPPAGVERDRLVGLIFFGEHPPTVWHGLHHPQQQAWLDALAEAAA